MVLSEGTWNPGTLPKVERYDRTERCHLPLYRPYFGDKEGVDWRAEQTSYVVIERDIFLNLLQRSGRCIDPTS
jgi:hypothetical protein